MVAANDNHNDRLDRLYELLGLVNEPTVDLAGVQQILRGLLEEAIHVRTAVRDGIEASFY